MSSSACYFRSSKFRVGAQGVARVDEQLAPGRGAVEDTGGSLGRRGREHGPEWYFLGRSFCGQKFANVCQFLAGSFSALSKPIVATKYLMESSDRVSAKANLRHRKKRRFFNRKAS